MVQPWGRVLVPAQGIGHKNVSLSMSAGTWHAPHPQGGGWSLQADYKHGDPRMARTRRLYD